MKSCICIAALLLLISGLNGASAEPIDRRALVSRHEVHVREVDPWSPLSVGNGDFAFTVDVTGLQSFGDHYFKNGIPTETLSSLPWAWHSFPNTDGVRREDAEKEYPFHGRTIRYDSLQNSPAGKYFRESPHPVPLGEIGFRYRGEPLKPEAITDIHQRLDLWSGVIYSQFAIEGQPVSVETVAHPERSLVAVKATSPLVKERSLEVSIRFPYAYDVPKAKTKPPLMWDQADRHSTKLILEKGRVLLQRFIDASRYSVYVTGDLHSSLGEKAPHHFYCASRASDVLQLSVEFVTNGSGTNSG